MVVELAPHGLRGKEIGDLADIAALEFATDVKFHLHHLHLYDLTNIAW